jgi:hypothetical protein
MFWVAVCMIYLADSSKTSVKKPTMFSPKKRKKTSFLKVLFYYFKDLISFFGVSNKLEYQLRMSYNPTSHENYPRSVKLEVKIKPCFR